MIIDGFKYVSFSEFAAYAGSNYTNLLESWGGVEGIARRLHDCEARMLAFAFPNSPRLDNVTQLDAFCRAVYAQMIFEHSAQKAIEGAPPGVKSFKIGNFTLTLDTDASAFAVLNRRNIDPAAYAYLLREGLLYRGVERTVGDGVY